MTKSLMRIALLATPWFVGCNSCGNEKPYVPYTVDPSAISSTIAAPIESVEPAPPEQKLASFSPVVAKRLDNVKSANTSFGSIAAPPGRVIELLLETDVTESGKPEALAWVHDVEGRSGELIRFASSQEAGPLVPSTLVRLPSDFASRSGCTLSSDLRRIGAHTVAISARHSCPDDAETISTEWIAAVAPSRKPVVGYELVVTQAPHEGRIEATVDALDRDGDSLDDLLVGFRIKSGRNVFEETASESVVAALRYFDRPAGLSRDPHEPSSSFATLARRLERMAKGKERDAVRPFARASRQLYRGLCMEVGSSSVTALGSKIECGAKDAMHRFAVAEMEAALGANDMLSAVGAYERMRMQGPSAKELDAARKLIDKVIPAVQVQAYQLPFHPTMDSRGTTLSPVAIDSEGTLLIRADTYTMRFDPKQRTALPDPEDGPLPPWDTVARSPDNAKRFEGIETAANGRVLFALISSGGETTRVALPIDPPSQPMSARFAGWNSSGLSLLTNLGPLWIATDGTKVLQRAPESVSWSLGSPRSPDGKHLVHASSLGVVVIGADGKATAWKTEAMKDGYEKLLGCVVANGAVAIACLDGAMTRVFLAP